MIKALDELGLSKMPVRLREGVGVMAIANEPNELVFRREQLHAGVADDRLLASLLSFRNECGNDDRALLMTADGGLRIKARARQVELVTPDDSLANKDEPDETERQLAAANCELAALRSAAPDLRVTIEGKTHIEGELRPVKAFDAGMLDRLLDEWRSRHPHIGGMPDSVSIPGGGTVYLKGLAGVLGSVSAEGAAEHNATINRVFKEYEQYLRDWPSVINEYRRSLKLTFVLDNAGTAPADGVHVRFWIEADGVWLEELPDVPQLPAMPKRRGPFDLDFLSPAPLFEATHLLPLDRDMEGPTITDDEPQQVKFWMKRVMHHLPVELSAVHFQFRADESVKSFGINYQLVAVNIPKPKTGVLHVKLSVAAPVAPPLLGSEARDYQSGVGGF